MIKTLLFDFGDIFINLDKPATERGLKQLGMTQFSNEMIQINAAYEKGQITTEHFIQSYQQHFPKAQYNELVSLWNAILLDFPLYRLHFLLQLKKKHSFKLVLLSNTNELHIDWVKENVSFYNSFYSCFDAFYLSHEIGMRKPDAEIFEFVLREQNCIASEVLYVDDTQEHILTAQQMGIHTWHLNPAKEDITALFTHQKHLLCSI